MLFLYAGNWDAVSVDEHGQLEGVVARAFALLGEGGVMGCGGWAMARAAAEEQLTPDQGAVVLCARTIGDLGDAPPP